MDDIGDDGCYSVYSTEGKTLGNGEKIKVSDAGNNLTADNTVEVILM